MLFRHVAGPRPVAWLFSKGVLVGSSGAIYGVVAMATMLLPAARVEVYYIALFPFTVLIGVFKQPPYWLGWILRWDRFSMMTLCAILIVPVLELWGLWRWSVMGHISWTHLGHLFGFILGISAVLLLPMRISMKPVTG